MTMMKTEGGAAAFPPEAPADCPLCPRLVAYRRECEGKHPDWFNGAVESFGPEDARLLVIGLAPGVTGANRTGRPFTGDWAGDLLYATLDMFGFSRGTYDARSDDGLELVDCMITNAVRCVPPQNKPVAAEVNTCRNFLRARLDALPRVRVLLSLGKISHDSTARALGLRLATHSFGHGSEYVAPLDGRPVTLLSSYHCSRYNTNTGRLTAEMFEQVFGRARALLDGG